MDSRRGGKAPVPRKTSDGSNSSASEAEQDEDLAFPMDDDPKVQKRVAEKKAEKANPEPAQSSVFSPFGGNPFLQRGGGPQARGRHKDLLEGLRAEGDDSRQFQNLIELGEFLAMANEESLQGFPVDQFVPALVNLLNAEHNPEMMLLACRSITHLIDVLPAACASVVHNQAVPALCAKLLSIEYIDLAEQAMSALEKLSVEHGVAVLKGGGLGAVLSYLDFFPTHVQRLAVQTAANICRQVPDDNWALVADVLPAMTNLLQYGDQKIVDSALLGLSRLADNLGDETRLNQLASHGLLHHLLRLLNPTTLVEKASAAPGSSPSFSMLAAASQPPPSTVIVLRLLAALARGSPQLAQQILAQGIVHTLRQMIGSAPPAESPQASTFSPGSSPKVTRSTELQSEILLLINELLPPLPAEMVQVFVPSRNLLRAPPMRRVVEKDEALQIQQRVDAMKKNPELLEQLAQFLLAELMSMYQWTLNPHLRLRALGAIVKVLYHSSAASLKELLKNIPMSNFIASLLASRDFTTITVGLHAANILFQKLPGIFLKFFRREGVITEVERLVASLSVGIEKAKAGDEKDKAKNNSPIPSTPGSQAPDVGHLQSQLQLALQFQDLQRRAEAESGLRRSAGVGEPKELTELKEQVQRLVQLSAESENLAAEAKVLSLIAAMLVGREGISTYELLQANLVSALVLYMNSPARVANFAAAFTSVPEALLVLVKRVQEAVAKTEKFPLSLIDAAAFGNHGLNILKLLTHPFRLRVVRADGEKTLKEFPEQGILVEPLATWRVLDEYLYGRVQPGTEAAPGAETPAAPPQPGVPNPGLGNAQQVLANLLRNLNNSNGAGNNNGDEEMEDNNDGNDVDDAANQGGVGPATQNNAPVRRRLVLSLQGTSQELLPGHTVLQALRRRGNRAALSGSDLSANFRRLWETTYVVTYRLASEAEAVVPPSAYNSRQLPVATPLPQWSPMGPAEAGAVELYEQLVRNRAEKEPPQAMIEDEERDDLSLTYQLIQLLRLLEALNRLVLAPRDSLSASEFVNQKLSGKLMEQLADTFSLCSRSMPEWCAELAHNAGFLFPFDVRRLHLYASSYTLPRALQFVTQNNATSPPVARIPRKKVRISRERLLDSAMRVMQLEHVLRTHILEIEYFGEVGTGLGPTLEFYSLTSRALLSASLGLWYSDQAPDASGYVQCKAGLFPAPYASVPPAVVEKFKFLGRFVAKAVLDQRHVDMPFSTPFLKTLLNQPLSFADLVTISPSLGRSLAFLVEMCKKKSQIESSNSSAAEVAALLKAEEAKVDDLSLDFTLPGQPQWELKPGGKSISVTLANMAEYVALVCEVFLSRGVAPQLAAFASGFDEVFPAKNLHGFTVSELDQLFCGGESAEAWSAESLQEALHADHGYSMNSKVVRNFVEVLSELNADDRRRFLQFVTGAPRLPIGGFKALTPRMTIVRKEHPPGTSADSYLPSVMTCANYIKLPDYSSKDIVRTRMATAIREGQSSFHLS